MNVRDFVSKALFVWFAIVSVVAIGQEPVQDDWLNLSAAFEELREAEPAGSSEAEIERFLNGQAKKAGLLADRFKQFTGKQDSAHGEEAWETWMELLNYAASSSAERMKELEEAESDLLDDENLSLRKRITIRTNQINRTSDLKEAERLVRLTRAKVDEQSKLIRAESPDAKVRFSDDYLLLNIAKYSDTENALRLVEDVLKTAHSGSYVYQKASQLKSQLDRVGKPLDLRFHDPEGKEVNLSDFHGKVVLLEFWATWCPPCVAGIPKVKELRSRFLDSGFEVIGINCDTDLKLLQQFIKAREMTWPQHFHELGDKSPLMKSIGEPTLPAYWLIDRSGVLRESCHLDGIEKKIELLIAEPSKNPVN
ncbi:TlpA family protein disulfide reductase [Stieleria sp. JC731]|uniref:TlpA family protein disulfide reductase n=1 Tax=Pirellulaceae TaxID=2691357 RepID=UPI001E37465A|nr:TlpA disulfide reductase family protein [Stieleria sp. JC731]MCC9603714.1 TlpA family protein disulfide reductase [Stieleria sp. JC731]